MAKLFRQGPGRAVLDQHRLEQEQTLWHHVHAGAKLGEAEVRLPFAVRADASMRSSFGRRAGELSQERFMRDSATRLGQPSRAGFGRKSCPMGKTARAPPSRRSSSCRAAAPLLVIESDPVCFVPASARARDRIQSGEELRRKLPGPSQRVERLLGDRDSPLRVQAILSGMVGDPSSAWCAARKEFVVIPSKPMHPFGAWRRRWASRRTPTGGWLRPESGGTAVVPHAVAATGRTCAHLPRPGTAREPI